ncbi:MAG: hypothetical protein JSV62_07840 [Promethearchaeota archaeon]|nr:MAG: hypothetical protein JSV62_07840 [Candidatus Lokiarchaeota archaeon]
MIVKSTQVATLIEEAEIEERNYNWQKAARLYEQAAKLFSENKMLEDAARTYVKFGDICIRAVKASKIKEEYLNWTSQSIKAFHMAENFFIQSNNELLSMECKARALNAMSYTITSIEKGRDALKKSINVCLELIKIYSTKKDKNNLINLSI